MNAFEKVKRYWWVFAGLIVLILVIVFFTSCESAPEQSGNVPDAVKKVWDSASSRVPAADDMKQTTPKGITVYSRAGLSQDHLAQADEALTELFADIEANFAGQTDPKSMKFAVYDIYEPDHDCVLSPESRVPAFYVKNSSLSYDGSQWDMYNSKGPGVKDGKSVVMAPERVFSMTTTGSTITVNGSTQPARGRMLVCPDLGAWRNAVRYGGEHNVAESACNLQADGTPANALCVLAYTHRTHLQGGHPFIPSRMSGLVSPAKTKWGEFVFEE